MMPIRNGSNRPHTMWSVVALLALILSVLTAVAAFAGEKAKNGDWKNIQLIYSTDIKGKIEPCG